MLVLELMTRDRKANGEWGKPKAATVTASDVQTLPACDDRRILEKLLGAQPYYDWSTGLDYSHGLARVRVGGVLVSEIAPLLCATGRCLARVEESATMPAPLQLEHRDANPGQAGGLARSQAAAAAQRAASQPRTNLLPLVWDAGAPWMFKIRICRDESTGGYVLDGWFIRAAERLEILEPLLVLADDVLVTRTSAARLDHGCAFAWLAALRRTASITVPAQAHAELVDALIAQAPPVAEVPDYLHIDIVSPRPRPHLRLRRPTAFRSDRLLAETTFDYAGTAIPSDAPRPVIRAAEGTRAIRRDTDAEQQYLATLQRLGCRYEWSGEHNRSVLQLPSRAMPKAVRQLLSEGWHVEAEGRAYRKPGSASTSIRSGIDWFELHGQVSYDEHIVALPALLSALERGETFVTLDDGTVGLLPEEWIRKHVTVARFGSPEGDHLRFRPSQAALLDALLATQPDVSCDETFARAREQLKAFNGIRPQDPAATFSGTLRAYQREGVGWLTFLQQFGFGGCLADDMGLGKTVMVLAMLDWRRTVQPPGDRRPSLAVVPRSLVFNWRQEAARFTPELRVLDYSGVGREELQEQFNDVDLVVTTYGTLRRDAAWLATHAFDYVVLDEAQAIKNAQTASAKACRLLEARHRLALSGTPVENHLGELGSLFEFLNPGLLGRIAFARFVNGGIDEEQLTLLARGLRPFILRRTKEQVASELPSKTEQTIYCELEPPQRALYDELRRHYRSALLERIGEKGLAQAKLQILEALLRLRQAACHPALVDKGRSADSCAKLDVLVPRVLEAVEEGNKTLVFSQFTSFLAILRARLDKEGVSYEYLDGRTRDREARVSRFQSDPGVRLFLISLKAGGLGLNLTAAEYVFLLDPWWNPAVETQAIDRAHRIGQSRHVFAYRLIARNTVEERVLELQQHKRRLADAILTADNSLIRSLRREDLELLLS